MANIQTPTARRKLATRNEPYWHTVSKCRAIGYRKPVSGAGTWTARITLPNGKYVRLRLGEADDTGTAKPPLTLSYEDAQEAARNWFIEQEGLTADGHMTVAKAMEEYLEFLDAEKSDTARGVAASAINKHVLPTFKNTQLSELTTNGVKRWRNSLVKKGLTKSTVNRILSTFKAALNLAYTEGYVASNSAWGRVEKFKNADKVRKEFFTREEIDAFLQAAQDIDPAFADFTGAMFYAGTRPGDFELSALRVKDVSLDTSAIEVTEGKTGERTVYVPRVGMEIIRRNMKGKRQGDLVFMTSEGRSWNGPAIRKRFHRVITAAGLSADAVPYVLRHSHISQALVGGLNIQLIAKNCGTSVKMIEKHYGKFIPSDRQRLIDGVF